MNIFQKVSQNLPEQIYVFWKKNEGSFLDAVARLLPAVTGELYQKLF
jgi:hypothetical protein